MSSSDRVRQQLRRVIDGAITRYVTEGTTDLSRVTGVLDPRHIGTPNYTVAPGSTYFYLPGTGSPPGWTSGSDPTFPVSQRDRGLWAISAPIGSLTGTQAEAVESDFTLPNDGTYTSIEFSPIRWRDLQAVADVYSYSFGIHPGDGAGACDTTRYIRVRYEWQGNATPGYRMRAEYANGTGETASGWIPLPGQLIPQDIGARLALQQDGTGMNANAYGGSTGGFIAQVLLVQAALTWLAAPAWYRVERIRATATSSNADVIAIGGVRVFEDVA